MAIVFAIAFKNKALPNSLTFIKHKSKTNMKLFKNTIDLNLLLIFTPNIFRLYLQND